VVGAQAIARLAIGRAVEEREVEPARPILFRLSGEVEVRPLPESVSRVLPGSAIRGIDVMCLRPRSSADWLHFYKALSALPTPAASGSAVIASTNKSTCHHL
jgi:hypothetical protein